MERNIIGFYHDPPLWVEGCPTDMTRPTPPDFDSFRDVVFNRSLTGGIDIEVTREGIFSFHFTAWEPGMLSSTREAEMGVDFDKTIDATLNRGQLMNSFLAFLYTNEVRIGGMARDWMVVTPELMIAMGEGMGFGNSRVSRLAQSSFSSTYNPLMPATFDERLIGRLGVVSTDVIDAAVDDLDLTMEWYPTDGLLLVDLFLHAGKAYQDHNYSSALMLNWAVSEKLLQELWVRYKADNKIREGKVFIAGDRAKRLMDSRTYSAAVVAEILSFAGYIDFELYACLSKVRKSRNDWIHSLSEISRQDAQLSTEVCEQMLYNERSIGLIGKRGLSIHG